MSETTDQLNNKCEICKGIPSGNGMPFCLDCNTKFIFGFSPVVCISCRETPKASPFVIWVDHKDLPASMRDSLKEHQQVTAGHMIFVQNTCAFCQPEN